MHRAPRRWTADGMRVVMNGQREESGIRSAVSSTDAPGVMPCTLPGQRSTSDPWQILGRKGVLK
ncbi:hypothetical protein [Streptomyces sp. NPDC002671]